MPQRSFFLQLQHKVWILSEAIRYSMTAEADESVCSMNSTELGACYNKFLKHNTTSAEQLHLSQSKHGR